MAKFARQAKRQAARKQPKIRRLRFEMNPRTGLGDTRRVGWMKPQGSDPDGRAAAIHDAHNRA